MMSKPKGLKNIPAIRQNVAIFLRNICLQVITIHLFGFKVYEFEKIKFFLINIFVQVIILCIFVEIIKKSTTMKNLIISLVLVLSSLVAKTQVIDINNFDEKLFEKVLFQKMIDFRKSVGADSLVWSDVLYTNIAKPNTIKIMNANYLHHPDEGTIWKEQTLRNKLGEELVKKQNVTLLVSKIDAPRFMSYEIAAQISNSNIVTYQDLANRAIIGWSKSPGHQDIEAMPMSRYGVFAMSSCSVKMSKDKKNYFIEFDFSIPYCIKEKKGL